MKFRAGEIIRVSGPNWHGVVIDVFDSEGGSTILKVSFVKDVLRSRAPEMIEVSGMVEIGTLDGMEREFEALIQKQQQNFKRLVAQVDSSKS
jgi:hypothetical protein